MRLGLCTFVAVSLSALPALAENTARDNRPDYREAPGGVVCITGALGPYGGRVPGVEGFAAGLFPGPVCRRSLRRCRWQLRHWGGHGARCEVVYLGH